MSEDEGYLIVFKKALFSRQDETSQRIRLFLLVPGWAVYYQGKKLLFFFIADLAGFPVYTRVYPKRYHCAISRSAFDGTRGD